MLSGRITTAGKHAQRVDLIIHFEQGIGTKSIISHQSRSNWLNSLAPRHLGFEKQVGSFLDEQVQLRFSNHVR